MEFSNYISVLKDLASALLCRVNELMTKNTTLQTEVSEFCLLVNLNSQNSHKPPFSYGLLPIPILPKEPSKKSGGQIGHKGKTFNMDDTLESTVVHHYGTSLGDCGAQVRGDRMWRLTAIWANPIFYTSPCEYAKDVFQHLIVAFDRKDVVFMGRHIFMNKIKINILNKILNFILFFFTLNIYSQGSVDMEYVVIDSVNQSFIGKEIRVDFNSVVKKETSCIDIPTSIFNDTFTLKIKNDSIKFIEKWLMYVDEKLLREQSFRSRYLKNGIQIYELILEDIDATSITVSATVYDVDSTYINIDKKRESINEYINLIDKKIHFIGKQEVDAYTELEGLEQDRKGFEREMGRLEIQEMMINKKWIKNNKKKHRIERIVIDKSIIEGIYTKLYKK